MSRKKAPAIEERRSLDNGNRGLMTSLPIM
jgi:hypothetical protein